jgi:hypothetical protein
MSNNNIYVFQKYLEISQCAQMSTISVFQKYLNISLCALTSTNIHDINSPCGMHCYPVNILTENEKCVVWPTILHEKPIKEITNWQLQKAK